MDGKVCASVSHKNNNLALYMVSCVMYMYIYIYINEGQRIKVWGIE